jgi:hypothetical protein
MSGITVRHLSCTCSQRKWNATRRRSAQVVGQAFSDVQRFAFLDRGYRSDQQLHIGVQRRVKSALRRSDLGNVARVHDRDTVDQLGLQAHVVADQDHGHIQTGGSMSARTVEATYAHLAGDPALEAALSQIWREQA